MAFKTIKDFLEESTEQIAKSDKFSITKGNYHYFITNLSNHAVFNIKQEDIKDLAVLMSQLK